MGFKGFHIFLLVFVWVFKWYPLKPMQIIRSPYSHLSKPMRIATNKQLESTNIDENHLKPMRIAAIIIHKPALAAISMGFKSSHLFFVVFA